MIRNLDTWEKNHMLVANTLTVLSLILYFVLRHVHLALEDQVLQLQTLVINTIIAAVAVVLVLIFARTIFQLAVLMPSCLAIGIFLAAIFQCGISYSFMAFVGACAVCGVYFNTRAFLVFVLGLNTAIFVTKVVFGVDLTGPEVSQAASYVMWGLMQLCIAVIFVAVHHASRKYKISKRSMGSYHAMLASTPNLVALVDKQNRIFHISDRLAELASVQRLDMVLGRPILDVFDNPDMIDMIAEALDVGAPYENTATVRIDENDKAYGKIQAADNHIHFKITSSLMNVALDDLTFIDIADITPIMNARYEAESASHAKSDFLSKMSHEIRTPLNGILGMAEVMGYESIADKTRDQLETIKHSGNHLLSIINNILDFSKIEHGRLEVVPKYYLFHSLINDVISIITMQIKTTNLKLTVYVSRSIPDELYGDIVRIRQILLNILSNAVKYTHEGHVSLEVRGVKTGETTIDVAFKVSDTGIGLKQEDIDMLYDEFVQFDMERHHGMEGTGLGLTITYSLVNIMRGWIDVKSEYGVGSTFTVTLPQRFRRAGVAASVIGRENKNVLLYGLDPVYAKSIILTLTDLGVRHYIAQSETELFYKMSEGIWNFIFVAPHLVDIVENMSFRASQPIVPPNIVPVTDLGGAGNAAKDSGFLTLAMPTYSLPILNILNYAQGTSDANTDFAVKNLAHFTAPDAKVLVVDDIPTNLKVAKGLLSIYDMQIDTCVSGPEAIAAVRSAKYDLILMDHMMPGMDGVATMKAIKDMDDGKYADVPIVALTANAIVGTMETFLSKGFDGFLSKPIDVGKLNGALEMLIPREKQIAVEAVEEEGEGLDMHSELNIDINGIDVIRGLRMAGDNLGSYIEILEVFCKDGVQKIHEL